MWALVGCGMGPHAAKTLGRFQAHPNPVTSSLPLDGSPGGRAAVQCRSRIRERRNLAYGGKRM